MKIPLFAHRYIERCHSETNILTLSFFNHFQFNSAKKNVGIQKYRGLQRMLSPSFIRDDVNPLLYSDTIFVYVFFLLFVGYWFLAVFFCIWKSKITLLCARIHLSSAITWHRYQKTTKRFELKIVPFKHTRSYTHVSVLVSQHFI